MKSTFDESNFGIKKNSSLQLGKKDPKKNSKEIESLTGSLVGILRFNEVEKIRRTATLALRLHR